MIDATYQDVLNDGTPLAYLEKTSKEVTIRASEIEQWVRSVSKRSDLKLDWKFKKPLHQFYPVPHIFYLAESPARFKSAQVALHFYASELLERGLRLQNLEPPARFFTLEAVS